MNKETSEISSLLQISGPDSAKLLEGQLTCHVQPMKDLHSQLMAICNIKGRVLVSGYVVKCSSDHFLLVVSRDLLQLTCKTLKKYAVFSNVSVAPVEMKRLGGACAEVVRALPYFCNELLSIQQGIAFVSASVSGVWTPSDLNYVALKVVSLQKGCYIGQEIIARMHYLSKGKGKNRLMSLEFECLDCNSPWVGCELKRASSVSHEPAEKIGQIVSATLDSCGKYIGLAVVKRFNEKLFNEKLGDKTEVFLEYGNQKILIDYALN